MCLGGGFSVVQILTVHNGYNIIISKDKWFSNKYSYIQNRTYLNIIVLFDNDDSYFAILYLFIIVNKRRMMESIEKNRLITKLIKIISEKEKIIEKYRRNQRNYEKQMRMSGENQHHLLEEKLQQDIHSTHIEVKSIQQRMNEMDSRIQQLTNLLNEEVAINNTYQEKIKCYSSKQHQSLTEINQLKKALLEQQQKNGRLCQENSILEIENAKLLQKIKGFNIQLQYQTILQNKIESLAKNLLQYEKIYQKIGEKIDKIFMKCCQTSKETSKQIKFNEIVLRVEDLINKLEVIEQSLFENINVYQGDVLNETIDGLSIIMKSFQDKLQDLAYLTERKNYQENSQCKNTNTRTKFSKDQSEKVLDSNKENKQSMNGSI